MPEVKITFPIVRDGEEIELTIIGSAHGGSPGYRGGHIDNWTPDEPPDSEIEVILLDKEKWDGKLTDDEEKDVLEYLLLQVEDDREARYDDEVDRRYDEMREREMFGDDDYYD